jgi:hypothetical protein
MQILSSFMAEGRYPVDTFDLWPLTCFAFASATTRNLAPFLVLPHFEKLLPCQGRFAGVREFPMRNVALIGVVTGDLPQVVPQVFRQVLQFFPDHGGLSATQ